MCVGVCVCVCVCVCARFQDPEPCGLETSGERAYHIEFVLGLWVQRLFPKDQNFCHLCIVMELAGGGCVAVAVCVAMTCHNCLAPEFPQSSHILTKLEKALYLGGWLVVWFGLATLGCH